MRAAMCTMLLLDISDVVSICEDGGITASLWVLASATVGMLAAVLPLLTKFVQKRIADTEIGKVWRVSSTWLLLLTGLLPAALFLALTYYLGRDFRDCVSGPGFVVGLCATWLSYLFVVVLGHLLTWRRELFGR